MRESLWRGILIFAIVIGGVALLVAGINRVSDLVEQQNQELLPAAAENTINLPMTISEIAPYPYPEPEPFVELQGGSTNIIFGAVVIVFIIIGGVLYGRNKVPS